MMIPIRNITACDHCGKCCENAPCMVGSPEEAKAVGLEHIQIERVPTGQFQVRVSTAPCVFHVAGRCQIEDKKPQGGREFKCWEPKTYEKTYYWSLEQLDQIGFKAA